MLNLPLVPARPDWLCDPSSLLFDIYSGLFLRKVGEGGLSCWSVKPTTQHPTVLRLTWRRDYTLQRDTYLINLLLLAGSITAAGTKSTAQKRHFTRSRQYGLLHYSESNLQLTACQVSGINSLFLKHHNFHGRSLFPTEYPWLPFETCMQP